mmetsp:Transcript_38737/g.92549  ORF Transcript_38737/g.92549 Transcript_38737/m.92549 type:complete len:390 (-) Transcript_38737:45-1214(-)
MPHGRCAVQASHMWSILVRISLTFCLSSEVSLKERRTALRTSLRESRPLWDKFQCLNQARRSSRSGAGGSLEQRKCSCRCCQSQTKRGWVRNSAAFTSWPKEAKPSTTSSMASASSGSIADNVRSSMGRATVLSQSAPATNWNQCRGSSDRGGKARIAAAWRRHSGHLRGSPWELVEAAYPRAQLLHRKCKQTAPSAATKAVGVDLHSGSRQIGHSAPPRAKTHGSSKKSWSSLARRQLRNELSTSLYWLLPLCTSWIAYLRAGGFSQCRCPGLTCSTILSATLCQACVLALSSASIRKRFPSIRVSTLSASKGRSAWKQYSSSSSAILLGIGRPRESAPAAMSGRSWPSADRATSAQARSSPRRILKRRLLFRPRSMPQGSSRRIAAV